MLGVIIMFLFSRRKRIIKKAVDNTVKALGSRTPKIFEHFFFGQCKKSLLEFGFFILFAVHIAAADTGDGAVVLGEKLFDFVDFCFNHLCILLY